MFDENPKIPIIEINDSFLKKQGVRLFIQREDLTDPYISGNKYRKLKYNLLRAKELGFKKLLTFGGAYSNHIHATAHAGSKYGFSTIGVIRGEETLPLNPTLREAQALGMQLHYVSRTDYRHKDKEEFLNKLKHRFGEFFPIPEGGSNALAVKGCAEMIGIVEKTFDFICGASGTGGTLAGIIAGMDGCSKILGFPALKNGNFLKNVIEELIRCYNNNSYDNWELVTDYHFGGYAKFDQQLITFINRFKTQHNIALDPIYTGKMLFGIYDMIGQDKFKPGQKILAVHSGGLQGIKGFNDRFGDLIA